MVKTLGALLCLEALFMLAPLCTALAYHEPDFEAWLVSTAITLFAGLLGLLIGRRAERKVAEREGYAIVALVWIVYSIFGMLPYWLSGAFPTFSDCWFETMSGFTTTGATIATDVESLTHGVLLWRSLSQWIGGMGIIVLSVAILPMFGLGGMQLYAAEVPGVSYEKLSPRIADTAKHMWGLYILITVVEIGLLYLFGMGGFDAVCHSLSTTSTGGFSTKNTSITGFAPAIQYTIAVFMFLSGVNFTYLIYVLRGQPARLLHDEETRWYVRAVALCTMLMMIGLLFPYFKQAAVMQDDFAQAGSVWGAIECAFRKSFFVVVTAMTSCGFAASDFSHWPHLLWVMVLFIMFMGASSGSTAGGIKWVRLGIFAKSALTELQRRIHPNAIIPVRFNGHPVSVSTISNVMAFLFFYFLIIVLATIVFCATGLDFDVSIGTAISAMGNMGVTIGQFAPEGGTYAAFPALAKWVATFVMLIGRLEIFTVLLLFTKALWKK